MGRYGGGDLEGVEGRKPVIRIYCMKTNVSNNDGDDDEVICFQNKYVFLHWSPTGQENHRENIIIAVYTISRKNLFQKPQPSHRR